MRQVAAVVAHIASPKTVHVIGLPDGPQTEMPLAQLLVLESTAEGIYLYRYTAEGEFCGDTWHETVADAHDQAKFEYEQALGEWYEVPTDHEDPVAYAHSVGLTSRPEV